MKTYVKTGIAFALILAVVAPALAVKNFNSAKSNTSTSIERTSNTLTSIERLSVPVQYSYDFNWAVDSGRKVLSSAELEILLEQVFDEIRLDVLGD